jgi:hypothetical protein
MREYMNKAMNFIKENGIKIATLIELSNKGAK